MVEYKYYDVHQVIAAAKLGKAVLSVPLPLSLPPYLRVVGAAYETKRLENRARSPTAQVTEVRSSGRKA